MVDNKNIFTNVLNEVLENEGFVDLEIKIKPISTQGANYTSALFLAKISNRNKDVLNLFG